MSRHMGIGAMIQYLGGNAGTPESITASVGKTISEIRIDKSTEPNELCIVFTDKTELVITDEGQSCCEHRYMSCDDDMAYHVGAGICGGQNSRI